jgi:GT2 family glycosyltransferase
MLIKKEVFKKIGLFDERFFLYYEDTDFSLRATKDDFRLLINPSAHIQHLEQSSSSNAKLYWLVLSGLIFFQTHAPKAWKPYLFVYLILRKIKNFYKTHFTSDLTARETRKAYVDFKKLPH